MVIPLWKKSIQTIPNSSFCDSRVIESHLPDFLANELLSKLLGAIKKERHQGRREEDTQKIVNNADMKGGRMLKWWRHHCVFLKFSYFVQMKWSSSCSLSHVHTGKSNRSQNQPAPGGKQKMFLEILQNSQKNTCDRVSFLNKVATLLKKRLWHRYFPLNFANF